MVVRLNSYNHVYVIFALLLQAAVVPAVTFFCLVMVDEQSASRALVLQSVVLFSAMVCTSWYQAGILRFCSGRSERAPAALTGIIASTPLLFGFAIFVGVLTEAHTQHPAAFAAWLTSNSVLMMLLTLIRSQRRDIEYSVLASINAILKIFSLTLLAGVDNFSIMLAFGFTIANTICILFALVSMPVSVWRECRSQIFNAIRLWKESLTFGAPIFALNAIIMGLISLDKLLADVLLADGVLMLAVYFSIPLQAANFMVRTVSVVYTPYLASKANAGSLSDALLILRVTRKYLFLALLAILSSTLAIGFAVVKYNNLLLTEVILIQLGVLSAGAMAFINVEVKACELELRTKTLGVFACCVALTLLLVAISGVEGIIVSEVAIASGVTLILISILCGLDGLRRITASGQND